MSCNGWFGLQMQFSNRPSSMSISKRTITVLTLPSDTSCGGSHPLYPHQCTRDSRVIGEQVVEGIGGWNGPD